MNNEGSVIHSSVWQLTEKNANFEMHSSHIWMLTKKLISTTSARYWRVWELSRQVVNSQKVSFVHPDFHENPVFGKCQHEHEFLVITNIHRCQCT